MDGLYKRLGVDVVYGRVINFYGKGMSPNFFVGRLQEEMDKVLAGIKETIEIGLLKAIRDYISTGKATDQLLTIAKLGEVRKDLSYHRRGTCNDARIVDAAVSPKRAR